jgi:hypothetical protein
METPCLCWTLVVSNMRRRLDGAIQMHPSAWQFHSQRQLRMARQGMARTSLGDLQKSQHLVDYTACVGVQTHSRHT